MQEDQRRKQYNGHERQQDNNITTKSSQNIHILVKFSKQRYLPEDTGVCRKRKNILILLTRHVSLIRSINSGVLIFGVVCPMQKIVNPLKF